ncbi:hypothetical protein [Tautonia rosea]|uniref:hypothetical protein n=1 Tax=Tautonia rosea TaxID=2728037 RepID=UPI001476519B|nr:hypothetical protein [Tautonia rosea]
MALATSPVYDIINPNNDPSFFVGGTTLRDTFHLDTHNRRLGSRNAWNHLRSACTG